MAQSMTGLKRGKPSNAGRTAKGKRQPRSLGLTYAAIRHELKLSQPAMHVRLEAIRSEYVFPAPAARMAATSRANGSEQRKRDEQRRRSMVSRWEGPLGNPPFSVSHRYGLASRTYSGILDLTSLVYAELREAGQSPDPDEHLKRIYLLCSRIKRFAENADNIARQFRGTKAKYNLRHGPDDREAYSLHLELINAILGGFRATGRP